MGKPIEVVLKGVVYRAYSTPAASLTIDEPFEHFVVAGVGSVAISRRTGDIVFQAPVTPAAPAIFAELAPLIFAELHGRWSY
jgi:hypothetical protein